ncbi:unnamed protein product, partial [Rotaria sp. Silwood1]
TVSATDCSNHRIVKWKCNSTSGQIAAGGNGLENSITQLNSSTDVIGDKENGCLIICDVDKSNGYLYVRDYEKHEVRRWKPEDTNRIIVAGGNGEGDRLNQLNGRFHIFVYNDQSIYVSDEHNHRVMKWMKDAKEGIVVAGGNGPGNSLTQLWASIGVAVDQLGTIYIADSNNHRIIRWPQEVKQGSIVVDENGK